MRSLPYSCACLSSCSDIFDFLELKKNHGNESDRARDLFYGMWIPDLFMKRVEANGTWSLFCPNEVSGLFCRLFQTMQWYTYLLTYVHYLRRKVLPMSGVTSSKPSMNSTSRRRSSAARSRHRSCGSPSSPPKWRPARRTCSSRY